MRSAKDQVGVELRSRADALRVPLTAALGIHRREHETLLVAEIGARAGGSIVDRPAKSLESSLARERWNVLRGDGCPRVGCHAGSDSWAARSRALPRYCDATHHVSHGETVPTRNARSSPSSWAWYARGSVGCLTPHWSGRASRAAHRDR